VFVVVSSGDNFNIFVVWVVCEIFGVENVVVCIYDFGCVEIY